MSFSKVMINLLNSYYSVDTSIALTGDWEVSCDFVTTASGSSQIVFGRDTFNIIAFINATQFRIYIGGNLYAAAHTSYTPFDGKLHNIVWRLTGTTLEVELDGINLTTRTVVPYTSAFYWFIGKYNFSPPWYWDGILSNFTLNNAGTITTFALNKLTGNTENSLEANNSVTYVNIPESSRDTYTLSSDGLEWLGHFERIANGTFETDTGWLNLGSTDWEVSGGTMNHSGAKVNNCYAPLPEDTVTGTLLRSSFEIKNYIFGEVYLNSGGSWPTVSANGAYSFDRVASQADTFIRIYPLNSFEGSVDNISMKRLILNEVPFIPPGGGGSPYTNGVYSGPYGGIYG